MQKINEPARKVARVGRWEKFKEIQQGRSFSHKNYPLPIPQHTLKKSETCSNKYRADDNFVNDFHHTF